MRILAEEGVGADVSTLGELRFALAAGITGESLVVHGNNKSDEELAAAAAAGALVVVDSLEEVERARAAGVERTLIRVTPGIEADTHEAIRTGHHGSKFGLSPEDAFEALRRAPETEGLHVHIGSQLHDLVAARRAVEWLTAFAARARASSAGRCRRSTSEAASGSLPPPTRTSSRSSSSSAGLLAELESALARARALRARA